ncbi:sensor histidine kinase [Deinococcus roseus]|uniref:histidine kinase n=1 Tax=Deinococcus roseus TaxID=392414 RepID=A0ABQ2DHA3_9DEIO|nr:ATP-binding protein [Deinococcus roseus]GGJ58026.1 hypothetical protein GCM10008938_50140 [Deinococcus roseus]
MVAFKPNWTGLLAVLLALLVWAGVLGFWGQQRYRQLQETFDTEARILHRVLSQRAEQHDALLDSLAVVAGMKLPAQQLQTFVTSLTASYPQIVGVQVCLATCQNLLQKGHDTSYVLQKSLQPAGRVELHIDPAKLLGQGEGMSRAAFTLQEPQGQTLLNVPSRDSHSVFPALFVQKVLGAASQPFVLTIRQEVLLKDFPVLQMVLAGFLILMLAYGAHLSLQVRQRILTAEAAVQQEKDRARVVLTAVDDALVTFDRNHTIGYANPAAMALLEQPLMGQNLLRAVQFAEGPSFLEVLQNFWKHNIFQELPEGLVLQNPISRHIEGSLSPLPDQSGAVLVLRDLGPFRARMLNRLEESERKRKEHEALLTHMLRVNTTGEVASGMAHELNQPLTAILSQSQGALRVLEEEDLDLVRTALERTVIQARRAGEIIQRLRAHLVRQPLQPTRVSLVSLVSRLEMLLETELQEHHIQLNVSLAAAPAVQADAIQLEQVLHNLIRNSMDALQDSPLQKRQIELSAEQQGGQVLLMVRDHGPGLSETALEHLFLPFHSTKKDGMGVGLSLSRTLMQSMDGELSGTNHPQEGAVFTLTLPVFQEELHVH